MNTPEEIEIPYSEDAEIRLLAILLDHPSERFNMAPLTVDYFHVPAHKVLWRTMTQIGDQLDAHRLHEILKREGNFEAAPFADILCRTGGGPEHVAFYVAELVEMQNRRFALSTAIELSGNAIDDEMSTSEIADRAIADLSGMELAAEGTDPRADVMGAVEALEAAFAGESRQMINTRWPCINRRMPIPAKGGYMVVAGPTGGGKTVFAGNLAADVINPALRDGDDDPGGVLIFSLEMTTTSMLHRLMSDIGKVKPSKIFTPKLDPPGKLDMARITATAAVLAEKVHIVDTGGISISDLVAKARQICSTSEIDLIVVDYIQLVAGAAVDSREQQVASVSRALRALSLDLGITVVALSQLNDNGQVRESRAIEQDAEIVLKVNGEEETSLVSKNRHGESGIGLPITQKSGWLEFIETTNREEF